MHDTIFIVYSLEQSPVYWNFVLWCVVQYFSLLLFQMEVIALLQQVMGPIKHLLLARGLWGLVKGTEELWEEATAQQIAAFNKRSQKAFSTMVMVISSSQLYLVTSCAGPIAAWRALRNRFECDTLVNRLLLKKQYFCMEMKEGSYLC